MASLIDPIAAVPVKLLASSRPLGWKNVDVWRSSAPPRSLHVPPLSKPSLVVRLKPTRLLVQERSGIRLERSSARHECLIIRAGVDSYWRNSDPSDNLHVDFCQPLLDEFAASSGSGVVPLADDMFGFSDHTVVDLSLILLKLTVRGSPLDAELAQCIGRSILACRTVGKPPNTSNAAEDLRDPRVKAAVRFIRLHLGQPLPLQAVAAEARVSSWQLIRAFTRELGKTPHAFILEARLDHARTLLQESRETVTDIAFKSGFSSAAHLASAYKNHFGMTPTQARSSLRPH